ncbi:tonB-system energizer ExbB [Thauera linaloolentis]|uniref:Biopolymer transport protein ExbB n=1 Tax=Thauera linaloolentis (strain DSM 12138 / JCM 21573 / CCUG 41526 / CIP 105981 / IAM 15112 / NBRC 102519 / 47Lol) TaxID=1123367 RepID=N6YP03_THAL4|nr:tonB-system energizer ExbB [Thauera linaloolentis]ENO83883.1 MotA/TolQ/ExbB proton channel family protein [Thauera linaloolentis 47Lol = DSM 12138]MCM8567218.1 tonB-system energizer ExbB [Thauera linaloolentis]
MQADFAAVTLPPDLTPWNMFLHADVVVQAVMAGLALASIATWTVLVAKTWELSRIGRGLRAAGAVLAQAALLPDAADNPHLDQGVARALVQAALLELRQSAGLADKAGIKERLALRLERIELACVRQLRTGTGLLATVGATAPFVGLFGTVWGIMNSFIGIARANTTTLAVVAPGIAEALLATALGLVAAIPAVVIYNHFTRRLGGLKGSLGDLSAGVQQLVSRDLDRRESPKAGIAAVAAAAGH